SSRRRNYATFLLHAPPTSYISTLSLHDALPICHRANDDPCSQREQRSARVAEIAIQCGHRGHRIVVEIELMLVDQACEAIDRKGEALHRQQQFSGDGIAFDTAMFLACQRIVPPLQA